MPWGPWWRKRDSNQGQVYPGNGPFCHLPPWERPGWKYGRGRCWRLLQEQQRQDSK